ncbi:MAG: NAD(P)/FAD-dependent oxidoreductase [Anaerolineales bacterium]|jgi:phytoene dehydrogenase-like protein
MPSITYDAIIVGSGPNGLAAAITLARAGRSVLVLEAKETIGGGLRSQELTLPGYVHDVCSAIHPLGLASPFFRSLPLEEHGLEWVHSQIPLAHPWEDGTAVTIHRSVEKTAEKLGADGKAYHKLMNPLVSDWDKLMADFLGPLPLPPRHPWLMARFGLRAIRSAEGLARSLFRGERARAVFTGMAAHSMMPLDKPPTAAFGLMLGLLAHAVGWPMIKGGSEKFAQALACHLESLGGEMRTDWEVKSLQELPQHRAVLFDLTPRQILRIAGEQLPSAYHRQLERFRYGPGVFKIDWALDGPIPWMAEGCAGAATVHVGGMLEEMVASERAVWQGEHPQKPYVLLVQQSPFDDSRAPQGKHTAWAYCHVPHGSTVDMTAPIEAQIERFAPGFGKRILARHTRSASQLQDYNANYIGGDINGGVQDLFQLFTRPTPRINPYATPVKGLYICSSSTPPGGGVHGMSGFHAAKKALKDGF